MRLLIFEALTGGGCQENPASGKLAELRNEGLAMVRAIVQDLLLQGHSSARNPAFDSPRKRQRQNQANPIENPVGIAALLVDDLGVDGKNQGPADFRKGLQPFGEACCEVAVMWDQRLDSLRPRIDRFSHNTFPYAWDGAARHWQPPPRPSLAEQPSTQPSPPISSSKLDPKSLLWISPRQLEVLRRVPALGDGLGPGSLPDSSTAAMGVPDAGNWQVPPHTKLRWIPVSDPALTGRCLAAAAAEADAVLLIAPQPTMHSWVRALGPHAARVIGLPVELLGRCEDKSRSTAIPSLWLPSIQARPDQLGRCDASHPVDRARPPIETDWFQATVGRSRLWCLKPNDQCGGSDVWQIELTEPVPDLETGLGLLRELRRQLPCATSPRQSLLWSPWLSGEPLSLSLITTRHGWWCLPACRQVLDFQPLPLPPGLANRFRACRRVRYRAAAWADPVPEEAILRLLQDSLGRMFDADQRCRLRGWLGLDCVQDRQGQLHLVEINPRLTSSYNLLRQLRVDRNHWLETKRGLWSPTKTLAIT